MTSVSDEKARRVEALATWWKAVLPDVVRRISRQPYWQADFDDALPYLLAEAQERWSISNATARDYARVAFLIHEKLFKEEAARYTRE